MFTIGDFATFTAVSVPALRLWDRRGLLEPARVDPATGYRYYTADQAVAVHRIVALKQAGLTLAQIHELGTEDPDPDRLAALLRERWAEAEAEQERLAEQIAGIRARLRLLERDQSMSHQPQPGQPDGATYEIVRRHRPAVRLAALSRHLPAVDEDPGRLASAFGDLFGGLVPLIDAAGVTPVGPAWSLYDRSDDTGLQVHAAFPVPSDAAPPGCEILDLPETAVVTTLHAGAMDTIGAAYGALMARIEAEGLTPSGGASEISLVWEPEHPERCLTEVQVALRG